MPPEAAVVTATREFKAGLLAHEHVQMSAMADRWLLVEQRLDAEINLLARELEERRLAGRPLTPGQLARMQRYRSLKAQTREQFAEYAEYADSEVVKQQQALAELGLSHASQAIQLSSPAGVGAYFDRLPVDAVQHMVGLSGEGKPIGNLLRRRMIGEDTSWARLTEALLQGTARGWNPRKTAREMRDCLAEGLQKALVIARTEQLRVYRMAGVEQYKASGIVEGQKRLCAHDGRVCGACLGDDGTIYTLDEIIPDHPNGRCTSVPLVMGMPEPEWEVGAQWLATQDRDIQRSVLGPLWEPWHDGQVDLRQLAVRTDHEIWGGGLRLPSFKELGLSPKARPGAPLPPPAPVDLRGSLPIDKSLS